MNDNIYKKALFYIVPFGYLFLIIDVILWFLVPIENSWIQVALSMSLVSGVLFGLLYMAAVLIIDEKTHDRS